MLSCSYIRTWKEEHGDEPSTNESMETTTDAFASANPAPSTSTPKVPERMETDDQHPSKEPEPEKKKPSPKGGKPKKSSRHHKF